RGPTVIASEAKQSPGRFAPMHAGDCFASLAMTSAKRLTDIRAMPPPPMARSHRIPLHQLPRDDDALQLVGALADHQQRRVAIQPLDRGVGGVAVAAMHAHR